MNWKLEDSKPVWGTTGLILFGLVDLFIGIGLIYESVSSILIQEGFETLASHLLFCQVSGVLAAGVVLLFTLLPRLYKPRGWVTDRSHQWVYADSGRRARDASIEEVYEHEHGRGSWEKKVRSERSFLTVVCILAALGLIAYCFFAANRSGWFPVLTQARAVIDSDILFWVSWVAGAGVGCLSILMLVFAFWDLKLYIDSIGVTKDGRLKDSKYENPSLFLLIPRFILSAAAILLTVYGAINLAFPDLSMAKFGSAYPAILPYLYLSAGVLWLFGSLISKPAYHAGYKRRLQMKKEFEKTRDTIANAFKGLYSRDGNMKTRYICAMYLLQQREALTSEGRSQLIKALQQMTGEDYGDDYQRWLRWLQYIINLNDPSLL